MNFPNLNTARLELIEISHNHIDDLFEVYSDEETMKYYDCFPHKEKDIETKQSINRFQKAYADGRGIRWGISLGKNEKVIGTIGLTYNATKTCAHLGYDLNRNNWNMGIISEAIDGIVSYAFEKQKVHRIEAFTSPENKASQKVLTKNGFVKEGVLRDKLFFRNEFNTIVSFSKLITD
jgi:ribosomal-protein-alanine N-acetyltransferase